MPATPANPITFWFDFISPYSYLAWSQIHRVAAQHERQVIARPVLFASLLDHWGQLGPAEVAPKRAHLFKQVLRLAHRFNVAMSLPFAHPFNPLLALRVAALELEPAIKRQVIDTIFRAAWVDRLDVTDASIIAAALDRAGLEGQKLLQASQNPDNKAHLISATGEALELGLFGVPTMVVDGQLFWGVDDLEFLDAFLRGLDPLDRGITTAIANLPAQSVRPRARPH